MRQKIRAFFFINSFQFSNIPLHPFPTLFQRLFPGRIMFSIKAGLRQMLCRLCDTVPFWLGDSKLVVVQNIQSTHSIAGAIPLAFTCLYYTYIYRIRITTKYTTPFTEAFFSWAPQTSISHPQVSQMWMKWNPNQNLDPWLPGGEAKT